MRTLQIDSDRIDANGGLMKVRPFSSMLLSMLFYTTLLSTMFVMPLILAGRDDPGVTLATGDAPGGWMRSPETQPKAEPEPAWHLPRSDVPFSEPAANQAPLDPLWQDKAMIRPVKKRAKTIKL